MEEVQPQPKVEPKKEAKKAEAKEDESGASVITIDQFFATQIKIGKIIQAEAVDKSKKLLLLKVDIGEENPRQVVAGIKEFYSPEDLLNTQVCLVANLKPAKLMGMLSEGMVLAAKDENGLTLIRPGRDVAIGTKVS